MKHVEMGSVMKMKRGRKFVSTGGEADVIGVIDVTSVMWATRTNLDLNITPQAVHLHPVATAHPVVSLREVNVTFTTTVTKCTAISSTRAPGTTTDSTKAEDAMTDSTWALSTTRAEDRAGGKRTTGLPADSAGTVIES